MHDASKTVWHYLNSVQLNILEGFNPPPHDRGQSLEINSKRAVVIVTLKQTWLFMMETLTMGKNILTLKMLT